MVKIMSVDEALNNIVSNEKFIFIRIQDLAKKMHPHYWKYREEILKEIHKWVSEHPTHSVWTSKKGVKYRIGFDYEPNMLELYRE